jgi:hypothetical protein
LVTGDRVSSDIRLVLVLLVTGDRVPADIRLVQVLLVTGDRVPADFRLVLDSGPPGHRGQRSC